MRWGSRILLRLNLALRRLDRGASGRAVIAEPEGITGQRAFYLRKTWGTRIECTIGSTDIGNVMLDAKPFSGLRLLKNIFEI